MKSYLMLTQPYYLLPSLDKESVFIRFLAGLCMAVVHVQFDLSVKMHARVCDHMCLQTLDIQTT